MLIFTRLPTPSAVKKYLFVLFILSVLSGCGDNKEETQVALEEATSQTSSKQTDSEEIDAVIDGGVDQGADVSATSDLSSSQIHSSESLKQDKSVQDNKSLIEDLGFSGAQDSKDSLTEEVAPELFCLDSKSVTQSKQLIDDACRKISTRLASVKYAGCKAANLQMTGCTSVKGFPILMSEFAPVIERKPQGRILIVGGTHGDELTSVSMTLRWIAKLNNHHSGLFHWHIVPMMNPDGVLKKGATRTNENGVDLNRNMPSEDWQRNAIKYWVEKGDKDPRKYPGEAASSEPETQWLLDEIESFKPDAIISVHAPYGVVDFDSLLLNTAPKSLGKLHLNLLGTYPGSLGNYAGINRNIPVITLELPHSWIMPTEDESTKIWEDIVSWLKKNVGNEVAEN